MGHFDIKPPNILLSQGIAKLADFGLSMQVSATSRGPGGTAGYRAPEVCRDRSRGAFDGQLRLSADVWSFACVLVCCVCWRERPYPQTEGMAKDELDAAVGREEPGFVPVVSEPAALVDVCAWCVKPHWERKSMAWIVQQLQLYLEH